MLSRQHPLGLRYREGVKLSSGAHHCPVALSMLFDFRGQTLEVKGNKILLLLQIMMLLLLNLFYNVMLISYHMLLMIYFCLRQIPSRIWGPLACSFSSDESYNRGPRGDEQSLDCFK